MDDNLFDLVGIDGTTVDCATSRTDSEITVVKLRFEVIGGALSPCGAHFQYRSFRTMSHISPENNFRTHAHENMVMKHHPQFAAKGYSYIFMI